MKINIREYKNKIKKIEKEFEVILEKIENQNIMNKENNKQEQINKIMVNKEEFFEVSEENKKGRALDELNPNTFKKNVYDTFHDENGETIPMILFGMSIGLFLGKFIKNFFV